MSSEKKRRINQNMSKNEQNPPPQQNYETSTRAAVESVDALDLKRFQRLGIESVGSDSAWRAGENEVTAAGSRRAMESETATYRKNTETSSSKTAESAAAKPRGSIESEAARPRTYLESRSDSDYSSDSDTPDPLLEQRKISFYAQEAETASRQGRWTELEELSRKLINLLQVTDNKSNEYLLALSLFRQDKTTQSFEIIDKARKEHRGDDMSKYQIHILAAACLLELGRLDEAKSACNRALKYGKKAGSASALQAARDWDTGSKQHRDAQRDGYKLDYDASELMARILEKNGENIDARFFRSLLPAGYQTANVVLTKPVGGEPTVQESAVEDAQGENKRDVKPVDTSVLARFHTVFVIDTWRRHQESFEVWEEAADGIVSLARAALKHEDGGIDIHIHPVISNGALMDVRSPSRIRETICDRDYERYHKLESGIEYRLNQIVFPYLTQLEDQGSQATPFLNVVVFTEDRLCQSPEELSSFRYILESYAEALDSLEAAPAQIQIQIYQIGSEKDVAASFREFQRVVAPQTGTPSLKVDVFPDEGLMKGEYRLLKNVVGLLSARLKGEEFLRNN